MQSALIIQLISSRCGLFYCLSFGAVMAKLTYKGWIGLAPIYLGEDLDDPRVIKRKYVPELWVDINAIVVSLIGRGCTKMRITGELKKPFEVPDD